MVLGMTKLQMHTATDEAALQHRASPGRTTDGHLDWLWAVLGMPRDQRAIATQKKHRVAMVLGLNLEHSRGRQIVEKHAPFNFRLHEVVVHFIGEVGMRAE